MRRIILSVVSVLAAVTLSAQENQGMPRKDWQPRYAEKVVYEGPDVVFRQIDEHTWEGNGHIMANESVYLIEGEDRSILIDAGTEIKGLKKIVEGITSKPVSLYITHVHPDHAGSAVNDFPELWMNAADVVNIPLFMKDYKGKINYLTDGEVIDLGGRQIEVVFTPGHTPGSTTYFDKEKHYGFSGDSFGSGNLLLTTNFSTLWASCSRVERYMVKNGIEKMYSGHYMGSNPETLQRICDEKAVAEGILEGSLQGSALPNPNTMMGLNTVISGNGFRISYNGILGIK